MQGSMDQNHKMDWSHDMLSKQAPDTHSQVQLLNWPEHSMDLDSELCKTFTRNLSSLMAKRMSLTLANQHDQNQPVEKPSKDESESFRRWKSQIVSLADMWMARHKRRISNVEFKRIIDKIEYISSLSPLKEIGNQKANGSMNASGLPTMASYDHSDLK